MDDSAQEKTKGLDLLLLVTIKVPLFMLFKAQETADKIKDNLCNRC